MKYQFTILAIIILLVISAGLYGSNSPENNKKEPSLPRMQYYGKLQLDQDTFNFGYTPGKSRVSHTFWLKNIGKDTMEIVRVRPGCSCTKAPVLKRLIPPNDSSGLEIIFSSGYYRGDVKKQPSFTVSDQENPDHNLHYTSYVMYDDDSTFNPVVEINPAVLEIIIGEEKDQYSVNVKNISDQPLRMSLVSYDPKAMDISVPADEIKPGKEAAITLKLENADYYKIPGFEKSFTIEFSDKDQSRFTVPVRYAHESAQKPKGGYPAGWGK